MTIETVHSSGMTVFQAVHQTKTTQPEQDQSPVPENVLLDKGLGVNQELIKKIEDLTDNGQYTVRFEMDPKTDKLIVRLYDQTGEMIRQVPSEELMKISERLEELQGNLVDTHS